jgi:hypothetical protein
MTTIAPNPHSPYADADPQWRHIFPTITLFGHPKPGGLATAGCERLAVVPEEPLRDTADGELPDGLCPACLAAMRGEELPFDARRIGPCGECGCSTDHDGLCSMCRQDKHDEWWPTRTQA